VFTSARGGREEGDKQIGIDSLEYELSFLSDHLSHSLHSPHIAGTVAHHSCAFPIEGGFRGGRKSEPR
jgi:hypothetical protein